MTPNRFMVMLRTHMQILETSDEHRMDNAAAELQRRRERARLSQRAFRIRQATTFRELQEENARLKESIKEVVKVSQRNDTPALRSAIHRAAAAAGVSSELYHYDSAPSNTSSTTADLSTAPPPAFMSPGLERQEVLLKKQADSAALHYLGLQPSSMTFRLNCGLFSLPTSPERMMDPPLDIEPYLGPNKKTLAAQLYWYCTETSLSLIYQLAGQQPSRIASVAQHHPILADMFRNVFPLCSPYFLLALAEARIEFYRVGYCKADNLTALKDSALLLRQSVEKECHLAGQDLGDWLNSTKVAQVVTESLQSQELMRLEAAIRDDGTDVPARRLLETFIHKFWLKATCFGDGPRWNASYVSRLVEWLVKALSHNNPPFSA
ncbi:uncharacterized protein CTRU02_215363 [Colletotrichum truncatum]|uniref:Uncharacterized protein n=1 Tax=Colletotrichum truncatum TaxID=5467 RepID=A0ACC3YD11_COLTU|nr:uncharacterized protein CTRU02_13319 [Colletotrichum truncatum]KAF6783556.1 hypothetical protein CTRU02_13319 [Colletotrichum truncatum]